MGKRTGKFSTARLHIFGDTDSAITKWDWILFIVLSLFCFFSFEHGDIDATAGRGWILFHSNILNYYDVMQKWTNDYGANYLPSTFILFAIWVLPLKLLGFPDPASVGTSIFSYNMWYKLLPVLFYIASAYLIYRIALIIGMGAKKSKICMFAYMTMPLAFFSQFIFSQYDIFTVFFMLCGMYCYFRNGSKDRIKFCIFFGIAITFKYFALLVFLALLLLDEKNVLKIIKYSIFTMLPMIVEVLINSGSKAFWKSVFGFSALNYTSQHDFTTILGSVSFFKIVCCFMVIWPFFVYPRDKNDRVKWALYLCSGVCFGIFDFATWHPQWLMFVAPFWVLGAFISIHLEKFMWLDTAFILVFYMFVVEWWVGGVDDALLNGGFWGRFLRGRPVVRHMNDYVGFVDLNTLYSIIFVFIVVMFVFKHPKYDLTDFSQQDGSNCMGVIRLRFLCAVFAFAIPAFMSFHNTVSNNYVSLCNSDVNTWQGITSANTYEQHFSGISGSLSELEIQLATYGRKNTSNLSFTLKNADTGETLISDSLSSKHIRNMKFLSVDANNITLDKGTKYVIVLQSDATPENCYAFAQAEDANALDGTYATVNGEKKNINMSIDLKLLKK